MSEVLDQVGDSPNVVGAGVARHASAEGCQFVVEGGRFVVGQRLGFTLGNSREIRGAIRWLLGDRIGFAFDAAISREDLQELTRLQRSHVPVRLLGY